MERGKWEADRNPVETSYQQSAMLVSYHRSKRIDQKTSQKTAHIRQKIKKGGYYTERKEPKMKKQLGANRRKETIIFKPVIKD